MAAHPGDVQIPGGTFLLGATPDQPFVFDNEKWAHAVDVAPFRMARAPVTNAEFAAFVDDGGYQRQEWWSYQGWVWNTRAGRSTRSTGSAAGQAGCDTISIRACLWSHTLRWCT